MRKQPAVYILASKYNGTLYIGVTSNLPQRVFQHKEGLVVGFSKKYDIKMLVHFEMCEDMISAIAREKSLKGISRAKKIALIEAANPNWEDLAVTLELFKP
ncbi:MAG TPA: endonuclease [Methylophilaceae bacterium]|nr:endonuclease [Methylophilaceae bacterium]HAJ72829.1 endonuclease [Methylophilaceae bacterium]